TEAAATTLATAPAETAPVRSRTATTTAAEGGKPGRKLYADYLAEAWAAFVPGIEPTPAWVRSVTDCGRATSKKVADALRAQHRPHREHHPGTVREQRPRRRTTRERYGAAVPCEHRPHAGRDSATAQRA